MVIGSGSVRSLILFSLIAAGSRRADAESPPILFVHGNGDTAALWHTTVWRFESNGYDPSRLFAVDMPHPSAPSRNSVPEVNRSTTEDQRAHLSGEVDRVLRVTAADSLVLVGSSRGGNVIRDYVRNGGGDAKVSLAILCGTPNHGVMKSPSNLDAEFNGSGHFLMGLNEGSEVHEGVRFVTLRSDRNDKYAQPTGEFLGAPGQATGVSFDGPELEGATNIVLPGLDHREVAFHRNAFRELYRAVTGGPPDTLEIVSEGAPVLDGVVTGYENEAATNLPVSGVRVEVFEIESESGIRRDGPAHSAITQADGRWGPFEASSSSAYELVLSAPGYPTLHYYRSPFLRSSALIHLRLTPLAAFGAEECPGSAVFMTRPRGYFGHGRDRFTIDSDVPDGVNAGVPGTSTALRCFDGPERSVPVVFNEETIVVRTHPAGHVSIAELHN